jgi:DNA repair photolyase
MTTITRKKLLYRTKVEYAVWAINHVYGCAHGCLYPCYAFCTARRFKRVKDYADWRSPRLVVNALELLEKEILKYRPEITTVYLCFSTDPFMYGYPAIHDLSLAILRRLNKEGIPCTLLTKGIYPDILASEPELLNEHGITLVSLNPAFQKAWEPYAAPLPERIQSLKRLSAKGLYTWVSIEPYTTPNIISQDLGKILDQVGFVNKIVFGRMNYNKRVTAYPGYRQFFNTQAATVQDFCAQNGIDCYIKEGTITA